jgi:alkylation response protein AidB-like acyl-CoA dehydrogenase
MPEIVALYENEYSESSEFDYAPTDFEDAVKCYNIVLNLLGRICSEVIAKNAADVDREGSSFDNGSVTYSKGTLENHRTLTEASLYGMSLPRQYDGLNFPVVVATMAAEMVARADAGFENIWSLQECAETLKKFADKDIKEYFLPRISKGETCSMDLTEPEAGSDLQSIKLRASWDEEAQIWRLNGVKRFITNGDADIKLVLARSEENTTDARGLSLFVYHKSWGGVSVRRIERKLGIKGSPTCEVVFDNAPAKIVGARRLGLIKYVMSLMNGARLGIGAQAVGISEAALREASQYATNRKQFGVSICEIPAVAEMILTMQSLTDASRALLYETARFVDLARGYTEKSKREALSDIERERLKVAMLNADILTPILKLFASEYANRVTYDAIQVFGGSGVIEDFPVARLYRDARVTTIYEGTSQLQVIAAAKYLSNGELLSMIQERIATISEVDVAQRFTSLLDEVKEAICYCNNLGNDILTLHQRRLVEMCGHILMAHLLYTERNNDSRAEQSFRHYLVLTEAWSAERVKFIQSYHI